MSTNDLIAYASVFRGALLDFVEDNKADLETALEGNEQVRRVVDTIRRGLVPMGEDNIWMCCPDLWYVEADIPDRGKEFTDKYTIEVAAEHAVESTAVLEYVLKMNGIDKAPYVHKDEITVRAALFFVCMPQRPEMRGVPDKNFLDPIFKNGTMDDVKTAIARFPADFPDEDPVYNLIQSACNPNIDVIVYLFDVAFDAGCSPTLLYYYAAKSGSAEVWQHAEARIGRLDEFGKEYNDYTDDQSLKGFVDSIGRDERWRQNYDDDDLDFWDIMQTAAFSGCLLYNRPFDILALMPPEGTIKVYDPFDAYTKLFSSPRALEWLRENRPGWIEANWTSFFDDLPFLEDEYKEYNDRPLTVDDAIRVIDELCLARPDYSFVDDAMRLSKEPLSKACMVLLSRRMDVDV